MKERTYSHSAMKTFQRCAKKWSYLYVDRIIPKDQPIYLQRGITLHEHLALLYTPAGEGPAEPPELSDKDRQLLSRYNRKWDDSDWEVLFVEEEFHMIINGYKLVFKPDLVVAINDEVWIVDHKTTTTIPDEWDPYNMTDFQHLLYVAGMRQNGYDVKGFIFNYIRTKEPTEPRLTKDGSRIAYIANIDTDYQGLLDFARKHGMENDPKVVERLNILRHSPDKFFQRHFLMVPDAAIDNMIADVSLILDDMSLSEDSVEFPRHVVAGFAGAMSCNKCPYQPICQAELLGIDTDEVLLQYIEKPTREKKA